MPTTQTKAAAPFTLAGYHHWHDLLFLHWRVPPEMLQPLLPAPLDVDTFDGWAWVGLVAFDMTGIRPWWFPPMPWISAFPETNLRTYVRCGDERGVWFFSLDAANRLAVLVARRRWHLNYYHSRMTIRRAGTRRTYTGHRRCTGSQTADYTITAEVGDPIACEDTEMPPGTLEHFLVERYLLFTQHPDGLLLRGEVRHDPYPLFTATARQCEESLTKAAGITVSGPPAHAVFSPGVSVKIGRLHRMP